MISHLELRHIMESAFLPTRCQCTIDHQGQMTLQLINPRTDDIDLTVEGINTLDLSTTKAIATLVTELKQRYSQAPIRSPDRRRNRR